MGGCMSEYNFYIASDGSSMELEDFLCYLSFKKEEQDDFIFDAWFSEDDFSSKEAFDIVKKRLEDGY